jgi:hypothetical protein
MDRILDNSRSIHNDIFPVKQQQQRRSSGRPSLDRRYSARHLLLIYSQTTARFDPLEIQRIVSTKHARCTIVRQPSPDSKQNYLAFVDFAGKRFQTRNPRLFDIQGYHPKWLHLSSSPWHTLDKIIARGEVIWDGAKRPNKGSELADTNSVINDSQRSVRWDYLGSASNDDAFMDLCRKEMDGKQLNDLSCMLGRTNSSPMPETEMSQNVRFWQDGYKAGYMAASASMTQIRPINSLPTSM